MNENYRPPFRVVEMNMGTKKEMKMASALIIDFPTNLSQDIFKSDGGAVPVISNRKTNQNKRYIQWGADNRLPTEIIKRAYLSPYIAPTQRKIINNLFSQGIKSYFVFYRTVNGEPKRVQIEYKLGGLWLRQRIREVETTGRATMQPGTNNPASSVDTEELEELKEAYANWKETNKRWNEFCENNNLANWLMEQAADQAYFWNWFPLLQLNIGRDDKDWEPKIVKLRHLEATCTRKGEMDKYGRINYCVYSREFAGSGIDTIESQDTENYNRQIIYEALDINDALSQLREKTKAQKNTKTRNRTTDYVLPLRLPTPGKPYYAKPSWYTLFSSGIFIYMLAMLNQRSVKLKNSIMFSYIIHLNEEYVMYEYQRCGAIKEEDRIKVYNNLVDELTGWLKNPANDGKALVAMTKTIDGKVVKWVEIEQLDRTKASDTSVKEDIAEIANVMLYAQGIHPQTVGAIPGKEKVASGTEARELNLLQQLDLFPQKVFLLEPLYLIKRFNGWDENLFFDIPVHVLTTLDKNKQGVEEMSSNV
ncbi:MAG: hypothetical protein LUE98_04500 [Tannerellaceae bacterium]|nr:hypothetical protein [Tannerellaceae bacterium]